MSTSGTPAGRTVTKLPTHKVPRKAKNTGGAFDRVLPYSICQGGAFTKRYDTDGASTSEEKFVGKHTDLSMPMAGPVHSVVSAPSPTLDPCVRQNGDISSSKAAAANHISMGSSSTTLVSDLPEPAISLQPSSATTTATTLSRRSSSLGTTGTAYVTPMVFGEMPTPRSGYENCCSGHTDPSQSSHMHGGSTTLSEQNLGGMRERYGLQNLNRQSLLRADGTEHSYFTLPSDYPLEQTVLEQLFDVYDDESDDCSTGFVDVFVGTTEHQAFEEEQRQIRQAPKYFGMPTFSPERPTVGTVGVTAPPYVAAQVTCLASVLCSKGSSTAGSESLLVTNRHLPMNIQDVSLVSKEMHVHDICEEQDSSCLKIISDVPDFTLELQRQDDERAVNCSVLKACISAVTRSGQVIMEHNPRELRLLWDPGDTEFHVLFFCCC